MLKPYSFMFSLSLDILALVSVFIFSLLLEAKLLVHSELGL